LSQYPFPPPPYSPPVVGPDAWSYFQPNAAGRVAAMWQLILGILMFLGGTCIVTAVWALPDDKLTETVRQQGAPIPAVGGLSPAQVLRMGYSVASAAVLIAGGLLLLMTIFIRRGGKASTICSIILNSLIALVLAVNMFATLVQIAANPLAAIFAVLICAGMLALCGITIVKLVASLKSSTAAQAQAMQQAYYLMMQQQQAAPGYGQGGYGYGQAYSPPQNPPLPSQENSNDRGGQG
jgi:hypothetical protein